MRLNESDLRFLDVNRFREGNGRNGSIESVNPMLSVLHFLICTGSNLGPMLCKFSTSGEMHLRRSCPAT